MIRRLIFAFLLIAAASAHAQHTIDGHPIPDLGGLRIRAVVLFFVASDCPVSNRTFPEMKRVREEFAAEGVRFWFVYPNTGETREGIRLHQASFDPGGEVLLDPEGTVTRLAGATTTPEVAVLIPDSTSWKAVYKGRIDNRFVRLGLERPQATEHFAERVIREILEGIPVERANGSPIGCGIMNASAARASR